MHIYLLRTAGFSIENLEKVHEILQEQGSPITFHIIEQPIELGEPLDLGWENIAVHRWDTLFGACRAYRNANELQDEDKVFLLTEFYNENNWFGAIDDEHQNGFVHTHGWVNLLGSDLEDTYPIAYHIILNILISSMFESNAEVMEKVHQVPRGCIMDFCMDKAQVTHKLRTGDLCEDCLGIIKGSQVDMKVVLYSLKIFDKISHATKFINRIKYLEVPFPLLIQSNAPNWGRNYYLGNREINLSPVLKTIYQLYLNHPEGIPLHNWDEHDEEIRSLYANVANRDSLELQENTVNNIINNDNKSEYLSRIRRIFKNLVGDDISKHYTIEQENNGNFKIGLDRSLVFEISDNNLVNN